MADRWTEITPSEHPHEREGLAIIRALLPDRDPFRAWSNFEFRDSQGKWHEVDLLVLGAYRLHLVELKHYQGRLTSDGYSWVRNGRREQDPTILARRKAQRLKGVLTDAIRRLDQRVNPTDVVPWVQQAVFLHAEDFVCDLDRVATADLFGLDGREQRTNLPGISERLLEPRSNKEVPGLLRAGPQMAELLFDRIGFTRRREREVGSWRLLGPPEAEGEGWQDWVAEQRITRSPARIRFYVTPTGAGDEERRDVARRATNEYQLTHRLRHDGVLVPVDVVDDELGTGLVFPRDDSWQRLDHWLADQEGGASLADQLAVVRGVAEALAYAHHHRIVHRGLTPASVLARRGRDGVEVQLGGWQVAGAAQRSGTSRRSASGLTGIARMLEDRADADERRAAEPYRAPEGVWNPDADRVRLDVFALGALTAYVVTGQAPASDRIALSDRLARDGGLDISAELPQAPRALLDLVMEATRPSVSHRLKDVPSFLALLDEAERQVAEPGELPDPDPLDAAIGTALGGGRFVLRRRLGLGSTARGLLVTDLTVDEERVLKVARDAAAAHRLAAEASVLAGLDHPRLVRLVEGPIAIGDRSALVLESAGTETLADVLAGRQRLSLDLLERYGCDLLEAVVALDAAGIDHRDVKPPNLGVRENRGDRKKHLVLFDFSMAAAGASAVEAGTPPYLDPFLGRRNRPTWDSAAERYAAAVTLYEMATGTTPVYGDGLSDPATIPDDVTVDPGLFDPAVATALTAFFRAALARDAAHRHHTPQEMLAAWRQALATAATDVPADADAVAAAATSETPLADAGLSARALSALEPLGVHTVADLVAVDPVRLSRLAGVSVGTRREVTDRAKQWRDRLGRGSSMTPPVPGRLDQQGAADTLLAALPASAKSAGALARLLLGRSGDIPGFASTSDLAGALRTSREAVAELIDSALRTWDRDAASMDVIDLVRERTRAALASLGGIATLDELVGDLAGTAQEADSELRTLAGLLRIASEGAGVGAWRRLGAPPVPVVADDAALLDLAQALAKQADALVAEAAANAEPLVPKATAGAILREAWIPGSGPPDVSDGRLVRLAAALSQTAAASGRAELHTRELDTATAVGIALSGVVDAEGIHPAEVASRVRARFPALPALPERPRLDAFVPAPLAWDDVRKRYVTPPRAPDTTGLVSRRATSVTPGGRLPTSTRADERLAESVRIRSFLAVGARPDRVDQAAERLERDYGAVVVDVTGVLLDALRKQAVDAGIPWDQVTAADAAAPGSRPADGLKVLVGRAVPTVSAAIEAAATGAAEGTIPVVLTEAAPLARYGHLPILAAYTDLTLRRKQAIWLLVPHDDAATGPELDGKPVPLASSGQFLRLPEGWATTSASSTTAPTRDEAHSR